MRFGIAFLLAFQFSVLFAQQPEVRISSEKVIVGNRVDLIYSIKLKKTDDFKFEKLQGNFPAKITSDNSSSVTRTWAAIFLSRKCSHFLS